jgi:hypothetical protein
MQIFDLGLQFARVLLGDTTAENYRQLVRSAEVAIGVQQSVAQLIQSLHAGGRSGSRSYVPKYVAGWAARPFPGEIQNTLEVPVVT